jgi:hypothetical protein
MEQPAGRESAKHGSRLTRIRSCLDQFDIIPAARKQFLSDNFGTWVKEPMCFVIHRDRSREKVSRNVAPTSAGKTIGCPFDHFTFACPPLSRPIRGKTQSFVTLSRATHHSESSYFLAERKFPFNSHRPFRPRVLQLRGIRVRHPCRSSYHPLPRRP